MALKEQIGSVPAGYRAGMEMGDEQYLWLLTVIEVGILIALRYGFRRQHGG